MTGPTPAQREASLEQLARLALGASRVASSLGLAALEEDLATSSGAARVELEAHRLAHGKTVDDQEPVT